MKDLKKSLGEALTAKELAEYLGVTKKTIRDNYRQFGGIKIGRHYRFFEKEIINALEKRQKQIHSSGQEERETERESISDPERGKKVGIGNAENVRRRLERHDRHGLLD
jgi:excisionase family DNA binding protein